MSWLSKKMTVMSGKAGIAVGAALVAIGAAGGAGAISLTRPSIVMAPSVPTAIGKLSAGQGIIAVKGRVTEIFGDRFVIQDQSGRTMIDAGRGEGMTIAVGDTVQAQGRYDNGQVHAAFLIDGAGQVHAVGPAGHGPRDDRHGGPPHAGLRGPEGEGPHEPPCAPVAAVWQASPVPADATPAK
jgi:hypothetical protein